MLKKTVAIAMSGGVDSSVAASLLLDEGYRVMGFTMLVCPDYAPESVADAALICKMLGVEHHILDLTKEFKNTIMDYFAEEYFGGKTPNPCVLCNPKIKFGKLMDFAVNLGADYFATGHYARVVKNDETGLFELHRGKDLSKDQAYALYRLNQEQLSRVLFPLGEMTKQETRKIAASLDLPVHQKAESQEICFIPDDDYVRFLKENYSDLDKPGAIIHKNGEVLGKHRGLIHYTVGQRKRLGIAHPKPLYVLKIDFKNNSLIVGYQEDSFSKDALVGDLHFIAGKLPETGRVMAKIRYNQKEVPAEIEVSDEQGGGYENSKIRITFDDPVRAVTPGQSAVFYSYPDADNVLGGGIILQE